MPPPLQKIDDAAVVPVIPHREEHIMAVAIAPDLRRFREVTHLCFPEMTQAVCGLSGEPEAQANSRFPLQC
jgi:hypothetical protein